jgi:16S rRNA (cytosine967-C5)-methyltransferase
MTPGARVSAAIAVIDAWAAGTDGLDRCLAAWGRANRFAGSGDRRAIADLVYDAARRLRSALWVAGADPGQCQPALPAAPGRPALIGSLRLDGTDPVALFSGEGHAPARLGPAEAAGGPPLDAAPPAVRLDLPDWLMPHLESLPNEALEPLRRRAALYLRVNRLKADPPGAIAALAAEGILAEPGPLSPHCLRVTAGQRRVTASTAFTDGLIEVQDAASQAVADLAAARPGETVLDYCAGGGGKTLALAAAIGGRGRLLAHDVAPRRLAQIAARAKRAGAPITVLTPGAVEALTAACDLVLVDAPCSGAGAWARNPDAKWRLTPETLAELTQTQDAVLAEAAVCVRPGGRLLYATCSLLPVENEARVAAFLQSAGGAAGFGVETVRRWTPDAGADGFFAAILRRS